MRLGHRMKVDARSDTEMYALFAGEYDDDIISVLCSLMSPGKNTVDVGANIGFYTVPFAIRSKALCTKVFAFEPVPSNFERLQENLGRNGVENAVHLFQLGLSSRPGLAAITLREDFAAGGKTGNAALLINDDDLRFEVLQVELMSLDVLSRSFELGSIGLMKVDIEGHEDEFLSGAVETIARNRPTIYMEIAKAYFARKGKSLAEAVDRSIPDGYAMLMPVFVRRPPTFAKRLAEFQVIRGIQECEDLSNVLLCPIANLSSSIGPYRIDKARCSGDWRLSRATRTAMPTSHLRGGACWASPRDDNFATG
jgi:FkbM family methyltransferase